MPELIRKVDRAVKSGKAGRGIMPGGTGIGVAIAANKFPGENQTRG